MYSTNPHNEHVARLILNAQLTKQKGPANPVPPQNLEHPSLMYSGSLFYCTTLLPLSRHCAKLSPHHTHNASPNVVGVGPARSPRLWSDVVCRSAYYLVINLFVLKNAF